MTANNFNPDIIPLQKDVIGLLEDVFVLIERANSILSIEQKGEKYKQSQDEIREAIKNVTSLELRMTIAAPMSAGKSTIINSIVGQELLPHRATAMSTIPTEIIFDNNYQEPQLVLKEDIISTLDSAISDLKNKIHNLSPGELEEKMGKYPQLQKLLEKLKNRTEMSLLQETQSRSRILKSLYFLNDIIRLSNILMPERDILRRLENFPRIITPYWRSEEAKKSEAVGKLVIVDTPGPNETSSEVKLTGALVDQLRSSSIVLIVLDFTKLNDISAEQIKKNIEPVKELLGKDNLYVLVNKVDQRSKKEGEDLTPEQVKDFVFSDLELTKDSDSDRVFEISAINAFTATQFLLELQQNPHANGSELSTTESFAALAYGNFYERTLQSITTEQMQDDAKFQWEISGFKPFLDKAIQALMENAAPRLMISALNLSRETLIKIRQSAQLCSQAITKDKESVDKLIKDFQDKIALLEISQKRIDAEEEKKIIRIALKNNRKQLKENTALEVNTLYSEEEYKNVDFLDKSNSQAKTVIEWIANKHGVPNPGNRKEVIKFGDKQDAKNFSDEAVSFINTRTENNFKTFRENIKNEISESQKRLRSYLNGETKTILEEATKKLGEEFPNINIEKPEIEYNLSSPQSKDILNKKTNHIKAKYKPEEYRVGTFWEKEKWWHWSWAWPDKRTRKVKVSEARDEVYYTVSLKDLVEKANTSTTSSINNIKKDLDEFWNTHYEQTVNSHFEKIQNTLSTYRDDLIKGKEYQQLNEAKKLQMIDQINSLIPDSNRLIDKDEKYIERTKLFQGYK